MSSTSVVVDVVLVVVVVDVVVVVVLDVVVSRSGVRPLSRTKLAGVSGSTLS